MEGETVTTPVFRENPYKPRIFEGRYDPRGLGVIGENQKLYITMERVQKTLHNYGGGEKTLHNYEPARLVSFGNPETGQFMSEKGNICV